MNKSKPNFYAVIPADVRYNKNLTPNAKLLYGEITALCNEKGYCWATNDHFANLYEVSTTSIKKWIKSLIDEGYINRTVRYKEGSKEIDTRWLTIVTYPKEEKLPTPRQEMCPDNNTLFNNTSNNKNIYSVPDDEFEKIWATYPKKVKRKQAYEQFKKKIKSYDELQRFKLGFDNYMTYILQNSWYSPQELFRWIRDERWLDQYELKNQPIQHQKADNTGVSF